MGKTSNGIAKARAGAGIREHIRANVVGYAAVFLALVGTAQALPGTDTVDSGDIIDLEVKRPDLATNAINSPKVAPNALNAGDLGPASVGFTELDPAAFAAADIGSTTTGAAFEIVPDAVQGHEVRAGSLFSSDMADGSLTGADVAGNSLTGTDINEDTLSVRGMGCQAGGLRGSVRVKGLASMPNTYTTSSTYLNAKYNCSGASVAVRRIGTGFYLVRFENSGATTGVASSDPVLGIGGFGDIENDGDNFVTVTFVTSPPGDFGSLLVGVRDVDGGDPEDSAFNIVAY